MSDLCQIPPGTPVKHGDLRGHSDAHHCCGKSLMGTALLRFDVRQHARPQSISKRAPSTTRTSLRLGIHSLRRSEIVYRKTLLQIVLFRDAICIQRFADLPDPVFSGTVSDLRISFDHLRRSGARITSSTSPTTAVLASIYDCHHV